MPHQETSQPWSFFPLVALIAGTVVLFAAQDAPSTVTAPAGTSFYGLTPQFAVSPDGGRLVFVATAPGVPPSLWVRALPSGQPRRLGGTTQASYPFWSADGREVGFFAEAKLKRVALDGGEPIVVCDAPTGRGGAWNRDGVIVFASGIGDPLRKVAAPGGAVSAATTLDTPRENSHRWPAFLPDGRHVMFWAGAGTAPPVLKIAALDDAGDVVTVGPSSSNGALGRGYVFHASGNVLVAEPFDPVARRTTGAPLTVVAPVSADAGSFFASFSAAESGAVLYTQGAARPLVLTWFDRSGTALGTVGPPGQYTNVNLSSDGRRIAVSLTAGTPPNRDIWMVDAASGRSDRLTSESAVDATPVWAPDGAGLVFSSQRAGPYQMYRRAVSPGAADELLLPSAVATIATDWSTDGRYVAYTRTSSTTGLDVWVLPLAGDRTPVPVVESPAADDNAVFAPDGRAIAYQSGASGRDEIYVRAFPSSDTPVRVSPAGGTQPRWRADGRELFYLSPDGSIVAVAVAETAQDRTFGEPRTIVPATMSLVIRQSYTAAADGQRFLTPVVDQHNPPEITVVPRWAPR